MQAFVDFLPVVAFVVAYWLTDFKTAIAVLMVAMATQVAITWLVKRTVSRMLLISAGLAIGIGAISLLLQNELVFKWKPTVVNWLFGGVFLASQFFNGKPVIRRLMESVAPDDIRLSDRDWAQLNLMWVVFFLVSGAANLYVAYRFSEAFWVNFKLFGLLGMTFVFVLLQAVWMNRRNLATTPTGMDPGP